jgi:putative DNA primase/helicase
VRTPDPADRPGKDEEELEKRLTGELIGGALFILLDNLEKPLSGVLICQCLTQPFVKVRIMRTNDTPTVPCVAVLAATGNNLTLEGDLSHRALRCDMDAEVERPEERVFAHDAADLAAEFRPALVAAGLTILKAYQVAKANGEVTDKLPVPVGGFEGWSTSVRDALIWLGQSDPWMTVKQLRDTDPDLAGLTAVIAQCEAHFGLGDGNRFTVRELISRAVGERRPRDDKQTEMPIGPPGIPDLREVLLVVAGVKGDINSVKLGAGSVRWSVASLMVAASSALGLSTGCNIGGWSRSESPRSKTSHSATRFEWRAGLTNIAMSRSG